MTKIPYPRPIFGRILPKYYLETSIFFCTDNSETLTKTLAGVAHLDVPTVNSEPSEIMDECLRQRTTEMTTSSPESTSPESNDQQASRAVARPLGFDFALLGLKAREARVEVIREAAQNMAARIQQLPDQPAVERDILLSDLATSTYRLLDPRRRRKPLERIQLSIFSETDFELQQKSREPLLPHLHPFVVAELVQVEANHEAQLREAKREIVQQLLESSRRDRQRLGAVTISLLSAFLLAASAVVLTILS